MTVNLGGGILGAPRAWKVCAMCNNQGVKLRKVFIYEFILTS